MATRGSRRSARGARSDSPESDRPRNLGVWPPDTSPITKDQHSRGGSGDAAPLLLPDRMGRAHDAGVGWKMAPAAVRFSSTPVPVTAVW